MSEQPSRVVRLVAEIRRRRVHRVALVYGMIAWLVVEVATATFPVLGLPDVLIRAMIIVALLGFPVALILAWTFDVTPQGIRRTSPIDTSDEGSVTHVPGLSRATLLFLTGLVVVAVLGFLITVRALQPGDSETASDLDSSPSTPAVGRSGDPHAAGSIAVLPFTSLSASAEDEFFSDGITEEILTALTRIDGLKVISRASVMQYKGTTKSVRVIGDELGVATVLQGSIRREGTRVRITAQLVDALTDENLWANQYDRLMEDIFAIQTEVAERIVVALRGTLSPTTRRRLEAATTNVKAYEEYLRGRFFWNKRTPEGLATAAEAFASAVEQDSLFALAHAGLADTYVLLPLYGAASLTESHQRARSAARTALRLDEILGEAHASLALVAWYAWDWDLAEEEFRRAIELNPGHATAHHWFAMYLASRGRFEEADDEIETSRELDPLSLIIHTAIGRIHLFAGRYREAADQLRNTLDMDAGFLAPRSLLIEVHERAGRYEEAISEFERLLAMTSPDPEESAPIAAELRDAYFYEGIPGYWEKRLEWSLALELPATDIAVRYAAVGDIERAFAWLDRAVETRDTNLVFLNVDPGWDPLRDDPRFSDLLSRMGLAAP